MRDIRTIIASFTEELTALIEGSVFERARAQVLTAFGGRRSAPSPRGRAAKLLEGATRAVPVKTRKKAPVQLCPVPGCKNPAAPIFGMVCSKHQDLPKAKIKKYREARKLAKLKAAGKAASAKRRAKPVARKPKRAGRPKKAVRRNLKPRQTPAKAAMAPAPASPAPTSPAAATA